jgi:ubiquinone/menaquinone biosynthesis C-methylase UbiE
VAWEIFEHAAASYEQWYASKRGRRAHIAECNLLTRLLSRFAEARTVLEVGCGTGHFVRWLAESGFSVTGLDRAPAMVTEARRLLPSGAFVVGDAHLLPLRGRAIDLVVFVTTLEFLENPSIALREAVRLARHGVIALVLNRDSLGGVSRRWGRQSRGSLLGRARDYSRAELVRALAEAAGSRLSATHWSSTLFPGGLWSCEARAPLGDVVGASAVLRE